MDAKQCYDILKFAYLSNQLFHSPISTCLSKNIVDEWHLSNAGIYSLDSHYPELSTSSNSASSEISVYEGVNEIEIVTASENTLTKIYPQKSMVQLNGQILTAVINDFSVQNETITENELYSDNKCNKTLNVNSRIDLNMTVSDSSNGLSERRLPPPLLVPMLPIPYRKRLFHKKFHEVIENLFMNKYSHIDNSNENHPKRIRIDNNGTSRGSDSYTTSTLENETNIADSSKDNHELNMESVSEVLLKLCLINATKNAGIDVYTNATINNEIFNNASQSEQSRKQKVSKLDNTNAFISDDDSKSDDKIKEKFYESGKWANRRDIIDDVTICVISLNH